MVKTFIRIEFLAKHRCFQAGDTFEFGPGLNLLVGDQGTGKSTLIDLMSRSKYQPDSVKITLPNLPVVHRDFEKDNVRTASGFGGGKSEMQQLFMSHGQSVAYALKDIAEELKKPSLILLDEPDTGMSVRTAKALSTYLRNMVRAGHTVIASIHNPVIFTSESRIFDMEIRSWTTGNEALERMLKC